VSIRLELSESGRDRFSPEDFSDDPEPDVARGRTRRPHVRRSLEQDRVGELESTLPRECRAAFRSRDMERVGDCKLRTEYITVFYYHLNARLQMVIP
jgi:hypothetical protein